MQKVILVNEADEIIGSMEKLEAHKKGVLHRAFSIFIFNNSGELLLQRRALEKYHSGGLWTNTCCSHPSPIEDTLKAAENRLVEEMGFRAKLQFLFSFIYQTNFPNGLIEHELDHVFVGHYNGPVTINREEAMDYQWMSYKALQEATIQYPQKFTFWFLKIYEKVMRQHNITDK
ncbi:isopentenyl-diphosphate Delta-isomerase [Olivibacter ginsenosidimutans]|uniref:Isopentenyl-diphosphate delta-isomerase n=1 Tax=Olivibacter ginsenosidimutans TaxID=1176537 RepID=A0ABP9AXQ0_9SPHI